MPEDVKSAPQQKHTVISSLSSSPIESSSTVRSDAPIRVEQAYRVLARKYRPQSFPELIGQEAVVRTLSNAIATGRIAHAFILTGVRGVGKTTTARIIARALNCVGLDGAGGPTATPCGECIHCRSIAGDRHVDVIEMDAASRTGVDDIRELTEGVRYRPVSARYKVYIIDEVHMLSKNAFNALLKTLEEPPSAVVFVFATTEIHKVPVTVLSRCQRFSLRRVPAELLVEHYRRVALAEGVEVEPAALALIARAADGSVRDGLSLLDQAIALCSGAVTETAVRDMLGVADRGQVFDLLETVLRGDAATALAQFDRLYQEGADPLLLLQDLLDLAHFLTRVKLTPTAGTGDPILEGDRERVRPLADQLSMPALTRVWQMLLKGLSEVQEAPSPIQAAEMVLVRLAYVADLPVPAELVRSVQGIAPCNNALTEASASRRDPPMPAAAVPPSPTAALPLRASVELAKAAVEPIPNPAPTALDVSELMPQSFDEVVALFDKRREPVLRSHLMTHLHLVHFEPGRIEFRPAPGAPRDLANRLGQLLSEWTGTRWLIAISEAEGEPTLRQREERRETELRNGVATHPLVRAVLDAFPGATIAAVRERFAAAAENDTVDDPEPGADETDLDECQ
ncbi:MAG: DNA polymerase III subunit gamma/tau [Alphaproteobacteria bacterium]|nr:DNA polymerase III subunit gamma/tau [Alphaproteobacteria bacterium]